MTGARENGGRLEWAPSTPNPQSLLHRHRIDSVDQLTQAPEMDAAEAEHQALRTDVEGNGTGSARHGRGANAQCDQRCERDPPSSGFALFARETPARVRHRSSSHLNRATLGSDAGIVDSSVWSNGGVPSVVRRSWPFGPSQTRTPFYTVDKVKAGNSTAAARGACSR
jgi:hypothetical protein